MGVSSSIFSEAFKKRSYFSARGHTFQELKSDVSQGTVPIILPQLNFNHVGELDRLGGTTELAFDLTSMTRAEGTDVRRFSSHTKWQRPFIGNIGDFYNLSLGLNTDVYHVNSLERGGQLGTYSGFSKRLIPEIELNWRLPFVKKSGKTSQVVEPIIAVIASPYGGNHNKIPNEDSLEMEFDDTNLFSTNRFSDRAQSLKT